MKRVISTILLICILVLDGCSKLPPAEVTKEATLGNTSKTQVTTANTSQIQTTSTSTTVSTNIENTTSGIVPTVTTTLNTPTTNTEGPTTSYLTVPTTSSVPITSSEVNSTTTSKIADTSTTKPSTATTTESTTTKKPTTTTTAKKPTTTTTKKTTTKKPTTTTKPSTTTTKAKTTRVTGTLKPVTTEPIEPCVYEPLNSNFKKHTDFTEKDSIYERLGIERKYREDFKTLYELGLTEIAYEYSSPTSNVVVEFDNLYKMISKILKIYNGEDYNTGSSWGYMDYLVKYGILTTSEADVLRNDHIDFTNYTSALAPAYSFIEKRDYYYTVNHLCVTNRQLQVIISRLLKVIDIGEPINNLTTLADVTNDNPDLIDFYGTLELYNLGIVEGDEYGRYNPYAYVSTNDLTAILARICYPSRRVKIDTKEYNKKVANMTSTQSYNNIDSKWFTKIKELSYLKNLYLVEQSQTRYISQEEAAYIVYKMATGELVVRDEYNVPDKEPISVDSEECRKAYDSIYEDFIKYHHLYSFKIFKGSRKNITKKELAIFLVAISENLFLVQTNETVNIKPEIAKNLTSEELHYLSIAVSLGLIENTENDFNQTAITQAEFEKILVQFAMKFSTFVPQNRFKFGDDRQNLVTDPELLPNNADFFPYVLDNAPKEVYEELGPYYLSEVAAIETYGGGSIEELAPTNMYRHAFEYSKTDEGIRGYFDVVLNIDYRTITLEDFAERLSYFVPYNLYYTDSDGYQPYIEYLKKYVEYVKKNEIILSGSCVPILPYFTEGDMSCYVRCKLEVNVIHSKIENPQFFCPYLKFILGTDNATTRYADVAVRGIFGSGTMWGGYRVFIG